MTAAATDQAPTTERPAERVTGWRFLTYLSGFAVSLVGDRVWFIALAWAAAQAGGPATTSLVLAMGTVPRAGLLLLGGAVVDRVGERRVMVVSDASRVVLLVGAALYATGAAPGPVALVGLAAVFGVFDALYLPAAAAVPRRLLAPSELPRGIAATQLAGRGADLAGSALGGVLIAAGGVGLAWAFDAATFAVVLAAVLAVRLPRRPASTVDASPSRSGGARRVLSDVVIGLRYVAGQPLLRSLLLLVTALNALGGPISNVGVVLLVEEQQWGVGVFAAFSAVFAAGAVTSSTVVAARRRVSRPGRNGALWALVQAASLAGIGLAPAPLWLLVAGGVTGVTAGPASAYLLGLVLAGADESFVGRVNSLVAFSAYGLVPIAYAIFGVTAAQVGVRNTALGFAGLMVIPCVMASLNPHVRRASFDNPHTAAERPWAYEADWVG